MTVAYAFSDNSKPSSSNNDDSHEDFQIQQKVQLTKENIMDQIKNWVTQNKVVLFMKGNPAEPRCGFSRFVVELLDYYNVKNYKTVDVLSSDLIRNYVKKYSNWQTFPQFYINGKLIGGCDILNEMHKEGTLEKLFEENGLIEKPLK